MPDGPFAVKRLVGESVVVNADIFADGHEVLAAELLWHTTDEAGWHRVPMQPGDERPLGSKLHADSASVGIAFTVEAWWDAWATFRHDLSAKHAAGQALTLEIEEGRRMLEAASEACVEADAGALSECTEPAAVIGCRRAGCTAARNERRREVMHSADDRHFRAASCAGHPARRRSAAGRIRQLV